MTVNRRSFLKTGLAGTLSSLVVPSVFADGGVPAAHQHALAEAELTVHPVSHASLVLQSGDTVIYCDPIGGAEKYQDLAAPKLILLTHEHKDHFSVETLEGLMGDETVLLSNPAVYDKLPGALQARCTAVGNGDELGIAGLSIEAVPAYNLHPERLKYHPKGRDNGYVLTLAGSRIYVAGDTEAVPEMRALDDIEIAFVPMNLPYTMGVEQAAEGVLEFAPRVVYPYHHKGSDIDAFEALVKAGSADIEVRQAQWYG